MEVKRICHVWFSTKGRKPLLQGEIAGDIRRSLVEIAKRSDINLLEFQLNVDHVHFLLELSSDDSLSSIMQQLKGACSREVFLKHPDLKLDIQTLWQKGYGFREIGSDQARGLRYYVRTQSSRPPRHT